KRWLPTRDHRGSASGSNHAGTCQEGAACDPGFLIFHEDSSAMRYRWMIYLWCVLHILVATPPIDHECNRKILKYRTNPDSAAAQFISSATASTLQNARNSPAALR